MWLRRELTRRSQEYRSWLRPRPWLELRMFTLVVERIILTFFISLSIEILVCTKHYPRLTISINSNQGAQKFNGSNFFFIKYGHRSISPLISPPKTSRPRKGIRRRLFPLARTFNELKTPSPFRIDAVFDIKTMLLNFHYLQSKILVYLYLSFSWKQKSSD